MATKEEREDRKKRIDKTKDRDNLIADNGLDGKVIDVYDILARSNSPVIVNLRKLNQYGITDVMIANLYENLTSSVETRDSAMDTLKNVYINLVRYINKLPNGIVIDPKTGEKDPEASYRQAVRVGIESNEYYTKNQEIGKKILREMMADEILPKDFLERSENRGMIDYTAGIQLFDNSNNDLENDLDDYRENILGGLDEIDWQKKLDEEKAKKCLPLLEIIVNGKEEHREMAYKKIREIFADKIPEGESSNKALAELLSIITKRTIDSNNIPEIFATLKTVTEEAKNNMKKEIDNKKIILSIETKIILTDKSSNRYEQLLKQRSEIYNKNPELRKIFDELRDDNGKLTEKGQEDINKYIDSLKNKMFAIESKLMVMDKLSPAYISLLDKRKAIYEKNPELRYFTQDLKDENGNITKQGKETLKGYINNLKDKIVAKDISQLYELIGENCEKKEIISEDMLRNYTASFLVGLSSKNKEVVEKSKVVLKKLHPEIEFNKNSKALEDVINEVLKIPSDGEYSSNSCEDKFYSIQRKFIDMGLGKVIDSKAKIQDHEMDQMFNIRSEILEVDYSASELQNAFNKKSNMEFTESDEKTYMELYKKSSIGSWISTKEEVFFHRYMAILLLEDKLSEEEIANGQTKYKICQNMLAKMQRENPELAKKISEYTPEQLQELKEQERRFEKDKLNAKVLDFYQKNVLTLNPDYYHLDKQDRFEYLRITILSRELAKSADTPEESQMLLKLSNRALEIMNTEENKFIEFDENGNGIVNEDVLLSEYKNYTTVNRLRENNLDEIGKNLYDKYQRVYFVGKMTEYSKLKDSDFGALKSNSDDEKLSEIISFKEKKNKERLDDLINQKEAEETNESEKKESGKQSTLKTEEISTDNRDFQDLTEEKSLVPQDNSIFGRFKKAINELKNNARDAFKKFKDLFAGKNPEEKNEEKNEINGQNPKKVQESAFDKYRVEGVSGRIQEQEQNKTETLEKQGKKVQEVKVAEQDDTAR